MQIALNCFILLPFLGKARPFHHRSTFRPVCKQPLMSDHITSPHGLVSGARHRRGRRPISGKITLSCSARVQLTSLPSVSAATATELGQAEPVEPVGVFLFTELAWVGPRTSECTARRALTVTKRRRSRAANIYSTDQLGPRAGGTGTVRSVEPSRPGRARLDKARETADRLGGRLTRLTSFSPLLTGASRERARASLP